MPEIHDTRRRNALALYKEFAAERLAAGTSPRGLETEFAQHIGVSLSMWSQVKANRNISDKLARQIEGCMKRAKGWLDQEHSDVFPTKAEQHFLEHARHAWRSADADGRRELLRLLHVTSGGG